MDRRLLALAALGAAACGSEPPASKGARLVLDIPNGMLDPKGYSTVEVTLHEANGDSVRSAAIGANNQFDFGDIDPREDVWIEASLRNDSGAPLGYGRTSRQVDLIAGAEVVVPIRRPIAYVAGLAVRDPDGNPNTPNNDWFGVPATFSDLSVGTVLDGTTTVATKAVMVVAAGAQLYSIDQEPVDQTTTNPGGSLTGPATIRPISTGDHSMAAQLGGTMTGGVQDGAGSDDGTTLIVGTTEKLFAIDTRIDAATPVRELASGSFGRVAVVGGGDGNLGAVAIEGRQNASVCTARMFWIQSVNGGETLDVRMVATGGFTDVASENGRAFYVDVCKGELGEVTASGVRSLRNNLGKPTALAVSNNQAFVGVEKPQTPAAAVALLVMPVGTADAPRTLWTESLQQVLRAVDYPGVERRLDAQSATFAQLEVGAGGDYVAASISGAFHGNAIPDANFPQMDIVTEELRVFDAASGGGVQRYRSFCDGTFRPGTFDIDNWACAASTGQSEPKTGELEHRVMSLTFLFGRK